MPVMSRSRKKTFPLVSDRMPETRLKKVVLPAPFGGIRFSRRPYALPTFRPGFAIKDNFEDARSGNLKRSH
jgi:hypothetical protein